MTVVVFCVATAEAVALEAALFDWIVHVPTCTVHTRLAHDAATVAARPAIVAPVVPVKLSHPIVDGVVTDAAGSISNNDRAVRLPKVVA